MEFLTLQKGGAQQPIHRSHSVPELNNDGGISLRSTFRVIPTTPRTERTVTAASMTPPADENGKLFLVLFTTFSFSGLFFLLPSFVTCDNQPVLV